MTSDELTQLVDYVKIKKDGAFEDLFNQCYPIIFRTFLGKGLQYSDAQDLAQEVLISVYRNIDRLRDSSCFRKWLSRIIHTTYCNYMSKTVSNIEINDKIEFEEERTYMTPQACVDVLGRNQTLFEALNSLKQPLQEVIVLRYFNEFSEDEIAKHCKLPAGTVKSRLYYARQKLQKSRFAYG